MGRNRFGAGDGRDAGAIHLPVVRRGIVRNDMRLTRREMISMMASAFCTPRRAGARSISPAHTTIISQDLPGDRSIRRYLAARAAELEREFLPGVKTAADFEKLRPALR